MVSVRAMMTVLLLTVVGAGRAVRAEEVSTVHPQDKVTIDIPPLPEPSSFSINEGKRMELPEVLSTAMERNHEIAVQELNVALYREIWKALYGTYDAYLSVGASGLDSIFAGNIGSIYQEDDSTQWGYSASLAKRWSTGTTASIGIAGAYWDETSSQRWEIEGVEQTVTSFDERYQAKISLNVSQDILRGFGTRVGLASIRAARADLDAETRQFFARVQGVLSEVETAYWELAYAHETLRIKRFSRALAERQLAITRARVQAGQRSPVEMLQVEEELAAAEEAVVLAEDTMWTRDAALRRRLDLKQGEGGLIIPAALPAPEPFARSGAEVLQMALRSNPEVLAYQEAVRSKEYALIEERNGRLPSLKVNASLNKLGQEEDLATAFSRVTGPGNRDWGVGLSFEMPLMNRAARASYAYALVGVKQAKRQLEQQEAVLTEEVQVALRTATSSFERMRWAARRLELAHQKYEAEEKRYHVGLSTLQDVLLFQEDLEEAALAEARARVDALLAKAELRRLEGDLPEGVRLREMVGE